MGKRKEEKKKKKTRIIGHDNQFSTAPVANPSVRPNGHSCMVSTIPPDLSYFKFQPIDFEFLLRLLNYPPPPHPPAPSPRFPPSHLSSNLPMTASSSSVVGTPPPTAAPSSATTATVPRDVMPVFPGTDLRNGAKSSEKGGVSPTHVRRRASLPGAGQVAKTTVFFPQENLRETTRDT